RPFDHRLDLRYERPCRFHPRGLDVARPPLADVPEGQHRTRGYFTAIVAGNAPAGGSATVKVLPAPGALSTLSVPPIASTSRLQIVRPSPVPLLRSRSGLRSWKNSSKMFRRCSGAMPMPVSET